MRIVMMGTGLFAEPTFEALLAGPHPVVGLVTQPDRAAGEERGSTRQTGKGMKNIALSHNLPVFQPESVNTPEGVSGLKALAPDLLVVAAYGQILSNEVLGVPPLGGINVHASLLPKYRGAAPIAWAIYHGETETGVTIIRMTTGLDAGDILAQEKIALGAEETSGEAEARLAVLGAKLAMEVVRQIDAGTVQGRKQDASQVTKAPKLKKENGVIDWSRHAREVRNQIRAMQPWPTPYTFLHRSGQPPLRLIIHRATWYKNDLPNLPPGAVIIRPDHEHEFHVAAGSENDRIGSELEIHELQPAGKRRMSAEDFLRGRRPQPGDRLGPEQA
jgi:methionyl-tRNA formyltransferase